MASKAKRTQRSGSPANRQARPPRRLTAKQKRDEELRQKQAIAIAHMQQFEAERASLVATKERIEDQIEDRTNKLNQTVGRVETFAELLGEMAPLPPVIPDNL